MKTHRFQSCRFKSAILWVSAGVMSFGFNAAAQILPPLDVTASQPVYDSDGATLLSGSNPFAGNFGYTVVPGCVVQILSAGANATTEPPDHNGSPTGDDTIVATTTIGAGMAPDVTLSGRFSISIYQPPPAGSRLYVRVFNATTASAATYYGQSSLFTVSGASVMDVSALGLTATTQLLDHTSPTLLAAASRKVHGAAGTFDLGLNLDSSNPTIEPRSGGPSAIVFTFSEPVTNTSGALSASNFTLTNATYASATVVSSNLILNLTGVVDQSRVTVVLNGIADFAGNGLAGTNAVVVRTLFGDKNQSGTVNVIDLQQAKNNLATAVTTTNFLCDVNCSGTINVIDLQQMKNSLTHAVNALVGSGSGGSLDLVSNALILTGSTNTVSTGTLGESLGAPDLTWGTNGDVVWTATALSDGSLAARSGGIGDLNVSWVETTVTGPVVLSFDWMVSSESGADYLTFSIDGANQPGAISGEVGWQTLTFVIPAGQHRVTWTYGKNSSISSGQDAGWLRRVVVE